MADRRRPTIDATTTRGAGLPRRLRFAARRPKTGLAAVRAAIAFGTPADVLRAVDPLAELGRRRAARRRAARRRAERLAAGAAAWTAIGASLGVGAMSLVAATSAARAVVRPPNRRHEPVRVISADADARRIVVRTTAESGAQGTYGMVYAGGSAVVGPIVSASPRRVEREVLEWRGEPPFEARWVRFTSAPHLVMQDAGIPFEAVRITGDLGPMPAAIFRAEGEDDGDWAIHVHGRGAVITEPLRGVIQARKAGWSSIVSTYRNDPGAPASRDRRFGLGTTESRDVEAAIAEAVRWGARRIILVGWSMGGATVLDAYFRSRHRAVIAGLMLESPVTSWKDVLAFQGSRMGLWPWVSGLSWRILASPLAPLLAGISAPLPLERIELRDRIRELEVPVLLLHSTGDGVVPVRSSATIARMAPDRVRFERFEGALHTRLWNVDPERWERVVGEWFAERKADGR